tara:strand:- start:299 stop:619 length:321 start_codon:yes stop_codon:yes gene_type:complete
MNSLKFNKNINELSNYAEMVMNKKGPEYTTGSKDVLNNFKATAEKIGVEPLDIWFAYFDKQVSSIAAHVGNQNLKKAEPLVSRFADIINYAQLGYALFIERGDNDK